MRFVEIPETQDERIEQLDSLPAYLRGERKASARVQWAIDEFFHLRAVGVLTDGNGRKSKTSAA